MRVTLEGYSDNPKLSLEPETDEENQMLELIQELDEIKIAINTVEYIEPRTKWCCRGVGHSPECRYYGDSGKPAIPGDGGQGGKINAP